MYEQMLKWKRERNDTSALLIKYSMKHMSLTTTLVKQLL